jgi:catechol 2,3-dioxygenase-like lactoylglutathione lyase family enzyme
MQLGLNNCIALGVPDREAAAKLYEEAFGFEITQVGDHFTEMRAGPVMFYLVEDQVREPAFSITVEDADQTKRRLEELGFVDAGYNHEEEHFMRDPYGYVFNLYPAKVAAAAE